MSLTVETNWGRDIWGQRSGLPRSRAAWNGVEGWGLTPAAAMRALSAALIAAAAAVDEQRTRFFEPAPWSQPCFTGEQAEKWLS